MARIVDSAYKGNFSAVLPLMPKILLEICPNNRLYYGDWHRFHEEFCLEIWNSPKISLLFHTCSENNDASTSNFMSVTRCYTWIH